MMNTKEINRHNNMVIEIQQLQNRIKELEEENKQLKEVIDTYSEIFDKETKQANKDNFMLDMIIDKAKQLKEDAHKFNAIFERLKRPDININVVSGILLINDRAYTLPIKFDEWYREQKEGK